MNQREGPIEDSTTRCGKVAFVLADLRIDAALQQLTRLGEKVPLPKLSYELLLVLVEASPQVVSNDELMARVWPGLVVAEKTVTQRVKLLRDALGDGPQAPR